MNVSSLTALSQRSRRSVLVRRLLWALLAGIVCAASLFAYQVWPASAAEQEEAIQVALNALIDGAEVETPQGLTSLPDRGFVLRARDRIYFINETNASDAVFLAHGLKRVPPGKAVDVDNGDVMVKATYQEQQGERSRHLQFSYVFSSVGGQGLEIRLHRGLGGRRFLFVHTWIS